MSRNDWECGTIKLPSADFPRLRQALQANDRMVKEAAYEHTQTFWKGLTRKQQTDKTAYSAALGQWERELATQGLWERTSRNLVEALRDDALNEALDLLRLRYGQDKPKRVLKSDVEFPTNKTVTFCFDDLTVCFDPAEKTVTWEVAENNHAVATCRATSYGRTLFDRLDKVRYTRATGGAFVGNDENNREADYAGGGQNYVTAAWGPLGVIEDPVVCKPWTDPQGNHYKVDVRMGRTGWVGKPVKTTYQDAYGTRTGRGARAGSFGY